MKNIKIYLILAAVLLLGGCDYLDIEPKGKVIASKTSEYRAILTGAYSTYPNIDGRSFLALLSDEIGSMVTDEIAGSLARESMPYTYTWQFDGNRYDFEWLFYYKAIFYANVLIEEVMDADVDSAETREQLIAEAYALRAYCHFELVNLYGKWYDPATAATDKAVPISDYIDIEQEYTPTTVAAVYTSILDDIRDALKYMEVEKQTESTMKYRFSEMAVKALESRVKLYMGDWQGAYDAAKAVIPSYTLADFNLISSDPMEAALPWKNTSAESILALDSPFGGFGGDFVRSVAMLSDEILSLFDEQDLRKKLQEEKWELDFETWEDVLVGTTLLRYSGDKCTFRAAELYLTAAEAAANIGTAAMFTEAKSLLLMLQSTRFTPDGYAVKEDAVNGMSAAELLQEIMDERGREFIMEGHRWFDLRRTTRPQITKTMNGSQYTLQQNDSRYTLPYPRAAIENNPNLAN